MNSSPRSWSYRRATLRFRLSWTRWLRARTVARRERRRRKLLLLQALVTEQLLLLQREAQQEQALRLLARLEQMPLPVPPPPQLVTAPEPETPEPMPEPTRSDTPEIPDLVAMDPPEPMPPAEEQLAALLTVTPTPQSSSPSSVS